MATIDPATFLVTSLIAGILGGTAMEAVLWSIGRAGWAKTDMIVALGSLLTKTRQNAWTVGMIAHTAAAIAFAMGYAALMARVGYTEMPASMMLGVGIGAAHGLVVSFALGWVVATRHPLEEFQIAGFAVCLSHWIGHAVYGAVVGMVVGVSPL